MLRVDLAVPSADTSAAQRLGAHWDADKHTWYVPENRDASPFAKWLPPAQSPNIRAVRYWIASARLTCWRCRGTSPIHGFALPPGHETLEVDDESGAETWESSDEATFVCYLDYVLPAAIQSMRQRTADYRYSYRRSSQTFYWANCCGHCGAKLGDYDAFCEPGQGFMPLTRDQASEITLASVEAPFAATAGGWSLGEGLIEFMTLVA